MKNLPDAPPDNPLLKLDKQLCFSVYALSRLITKAYQPLLAKLDVSGQLLNQTVKQIDEARLTVKSGAEQLEAELRCESAGLDIRWACEGDLRISGRQRYQLERIARELISNAIEHAQAKHIEVAWHVAIGQLVLRVADDGLGMPAGQAPAGVRARAADLLGQARWEARDGGGTLCVVSMPVDASQLPYLPTVHP